MDGITTAAAAGMRSRVESLELLANNLANASTAGYKADREFYGLYTSPDSSGGDELPMIEREWTDFRQGSHTPTGNTLDLALSGEGFLRVTGPGGPLYTRSGNLHLSPQGELRTADNYPVEKVGGGPLQLDPAIAVDIGRDGTVTQDGEPAGQLDIRNFADLPALRKQGETYFMWTGAADAISTAANVDVLQGRLESSNISPAEMSVRLINVMRQFEMLQRAVVIGGEMNRKVIDEVTKVS